MVQIYEEDVSDTENKDTHYNFLHWLKILIIYIYYYLHLQSSEYC